MNQPKISWEEEFSRRFLDYYDDGTRKPDLSLYDLHKSFLRTTLASEVEKAVREREKEKNELADALIMMYEQYCQEGHSFMTAGEMASLVLERMGYANFDEIGRIIQSKELKQLKNK